jgi:hypothetical protein
VIYLRCKSLQVRCYSYTLLNLSSEQRTQREFPNAAAISHLLNPFITQLGNTIEWVLKQNILASQHSEYTKAPSGKQSLIAKDNESLTTFLGV